MEITFREAVCQDAPAMIALYNDAFYHDYQNYGDCPAYGRSKDEMEVSILRFPKELAVLNGEIVGSVSGHMVDFGVYELASLCVAPAYQRRGIGKALVSHFLDLHADCRELTLTVPEQNHGVKAFFAECCGMTAVGSEKNSKVPVVRFVLHRD